MANIADDIEGGEIFGSLFLLVLLVAAIGVAGWYLYKQLLCTADSSKCPCDSGGVRCTTSDMSGNCVGTDGTACSWWAFLTGTSCCTGTPSGGANTGTTLSDVGSTVKGAYDYATGAGNDVPDSPAAPGVPAGYDYDTGEIDN